MNQILRLILLDLTGQNDGLPYIIQTETPPTPVVEVIDTHDGKRKRKKRDRDEFAEFAEQQAKRRKAIADIVDPQPVEVAPVVYESVPPLLTPTIKAPPKDDSFERFMRELQEDEELLMML